MLEITKLDKCFNNKIVLDSVSMQVKAGRIALILGTSGVGKSTLLRIVAGLETADNGTVSLDGLNFNIKSHERNGLVGMLFQHFNLFEHMTVQENITFALIRAAKLSPQEAQERAQALLARYQLADKAQVYAANLSGGQKQRLALARTLAMQPRVICLDEPTSALDPVLTSFVANSIQELAHTGYMVLVSSHDTALIERLNADLYLMQKGKIIEATSTTAFLKEQENYPRLSSFIKGQEHHELKEL